ncbi:DciA family protein [Streptomyces sp. YIM S03343]
MVRRDGREPMGLGAAIGALVTERAWELPAAGATLQDRWAAITPTFAAHVTAIGYDADSGRLSVCPESPAWATKLRLEQVRVIVAANASAGRTVVRALMILAPGSLPVSVRDDDVPQVPAVPKRPVKTSESASDGYQRALAAHRQAATARLADPLVAEAVERQTRAMRELGARAFPELDHVPAPIAAAVAQRRRQASTSRAAARQPGQAGGGLVAVADSAVHSHRRWGVATTAVGRPARPARPWH